MENLNMKNFKDRGRTDKRNSNAIIQLKKMISYIGPCNKMVEVGCYHGVCSELFAENFQTVFCVDPWNDEETRVNDHNMSMIEELFNKRVKKFTNITKMKMKSLDAVSEFEDESLDFVYLDARHEFKHIKNDIQKWLPKVKLGGYVGGHDYSNGWPGVRRAVNEIFGKPDIVFGPNWIVKK